ncbi:MAG: hypothetical protein JJLCMIEE_00809 [Acidimicrobiales bacterium]|nr:MAG: helix-turn-helix domain-containing protein [Actinomycetota bacterium]MBV6507752.1 hypothetical protein [Acidimicrobiales bacterium]RIK06172.1 MAG: MerR family transcriptional regulator [Acidobacteriota bacterium]
MREYRIGRAAELLGVSTDTVRRWVDSGRLGAVRTEGGQRLIDGEALAAFTTEVADQPEPELIAARSARNRFTGIITSVIVDKVAAQVEIQAGPHRIVSLLTREAVEELGLEPGVLATASVKATNVIVELPAP